jgi:VanZ family protein
MRSLNRSKPASGEETEAIMRRAALIGSVTLAWFAAFIYLAITTDIPQAPIVGTTATIEALGHFVATFVLALLLAELFAALGVLNMWRRVARAGFAAAMLALSIEAMQLFRPGRGAEAIDVGLDLAGAVVGAGAYLIAAGRVSPGAVRRAVVTLGVAAIALTVFTVVDQPQVSLFDGCLGHEASQMFPSATPQGHNRRVTAGLTAEYIFDEGSGEVASASENAAVPLDLALQGGVGWVTDGPGVKVDGPAGMLRSVETADGVAGLILESNAFTAEAWVMPDRDQGGPARVISISGGTSLDEIDMQLAQDSTCLSHRIRFGDKTEWVLVEGAFAGSALRHLAVTFADGETSTYVNGVLIDTHSAIGDNPSNWDPTNHLLVGNEETGERAFHGIIRLVAIYSRALTAKEIAENYGAGF